MWFTMSNEFVPSQELCSHAVHFPGTSNSKLICNCKAVQHTADSQYASHSLGKVYCGGKTLGKKTRLSRPGRSCEFCSWSDLCPLSFRCDSQPTSFHDWQSLSHASCTATDSEPSHNTPSGQHPDINTFNVPGPAQVNIENVDADLLPINKISKFTHVIWIMLIDGDATVI